MNKHITIIFIMLSSCLHLKANNITNLPDLKPTLIYANVFESNGVCYTEIIAKVKNIGSAASAACHGVLYLESSSFQTYIPSIQANQEKEIAIRLAASNLDPQSWGFEADSQDIINELNENNNLKNVYRLGGSLGSCNDDSGPGSGSGSPDLTVDITYAPNIINISSQSYYADFEIKNVGDASYNGSFKPNPKWRVFLYPSNSSPTNEDVIFSGNIGFISPEDSKTISIPLGNGASLNPSLDYILKMEVDWEDEVEESDETNNEVMKTIAVNSSNGVAPPNGISPFKQMKVFPSINDGNFQISNTQIQPTESFSITITGPSGNIVYQETKTGPVTQRIDLTSLKEGVYIIRKESSLGIEISKFIKK
ncbi:T9SS type A sorting domain-containing protein [Ekhidna sp.]|uniref:T9SS type A sorting domain-containing protein n=1 Tax=Ekhidna sp. TaxID=2608089 RepID=UPI003CCC039C